MRPVQLLATVAILAIAIVPATAQPIISAKSGVIASVEGKVLLNNTEVQESVTHFPEMKEGSVLRTEDGRVELMLPPGFMLRMSENGALTMLANRLIDTRVEIQAGAAVVEVDQTKPDFNVAIALKDGVVTLSKVGVYRFDVEPAPGRPGVFRAEVECSSGTYIRTLADDMGTALGGGAHIGMLRRTRIGSFGEAEMRPLDHLTHDAILTPAQAMRDMPLVSVEPEIGGLIGRGLALDRVPVGAVGEGPWAMVDQHGNLLAVYEATGTDRIKPAVVLAGD